MNRECDSFNPGDRFGYLTIVEDSGKRYKSNGDIIWKCSCACGNIVYRPTTTIKVSLIRGYTISCGCKRSKDIGQRELNNPRRIVRARKAMCPDNGTTVCGINRKKLNKNNKSGHIGVCWKSREQKWQADIQLRGQHIGRKLFNTLDEAIAWREYLEEKYYKPIIERNGKERNVINQRSSGQNRTK